MRLTMSDKNSFSKIFAEKYRYADKFEKSIILDEFIDFTGYNRNYATRKLREILKNFDEEYVKKTTPKNALIFGDDVRFILEKIWKSLDFICSKKLVSIMPEILKKVDQFNEIEISDSIRKKLLRISSTSIDRLLKKAKRRLGRRKKTMKRTKYLIDKIPIKTFAEWTKSPLGTIHIDLVSHNGGNVFGGFLYTLNATDITTSWTVCTLIKDKTMYEMIKGLYRIKALFPFPIRSIHSDNGSEFINEGVFIFSQRHNLKFTRGRPYKKNDNPYIEQKNRSILRRNTGYLRYDKPEHSEILIKLYNKLNFYTNYFQPTMQLIEKHRVGAKAIRKYDQPMTPYQRLLNVNKLPNTIKKHIQGIYNALNPFELKKEINKYQDTLINIAAPIRMKLEPKKIRRTQPRKFKEPINRRDLIPNNKNPFQERKRFQELRRAIINLEKIKR